MSTDKAAKLTKTEQKILDKVAHANSQGALAGLDTDPWEPTYTNRANRFIKRLADAGLIVYMPYADMFGAGWATKEQVPEFYAKGYNIKTFNYTFYRTSDKKVFEVLWSSHWTTIAHKDGDTFIRDNVKWCGGNNYVGASSGDMYIKVENKTV